MIKWWCGPLEDDVMIAHVALGGLELIKLNRAKVKVRALVALYSSVCGLTG